ncbi:MAG: hypothetical protein OXC00_06910 [Acidimicrobiaceae bacterium]|nr:hypothetical protein [Acidimicrobiaceae bacterium]
MCGLLAAVSVASATAQDVAATEDAPIQADPPRVFTPAPEGSISPALPFPGLSPEEAETARAELASLDLQAAAAAVAADQAWAALGDETADPIPPELPPREFVAYEVAPPSNVEIPRLAPGSDIVTNTAPTAGGQTAASACSGASCYQSDRLLLNNPTVGLYASQYWVWLGTPQTNESNKCDSTSESSGCFWFYAMQHVMDSEDYSNSALHIGPQRGSSIAGDAGNQWRMNIDGYIDGVHIGGQSSVNLPATTWIRVRTWRISSGNDPSAPYTPYSTWRVWAMYGGSDHSLGSVTIDGHLFVDSMLFGEVYEQNGPCSTDLVKVALNDPRFWNTSLSQGVYSSATAAYQDTCNNTTWESISQDHVRDKRETQRIIYDGQVVWQF